jgi:hypothetical protein
MLLVLEPMLMLLALPLPQIVVAFADAADTDEDEDKYSRGGSTSIFSAMRAPGWDSTTDMLSFLLVLGFSLICVSGT